MKSSFSLKQIISKITIKHDYIENEKKLDLIFGLADESKVLQVIVHYEQFIDVNKASGVTSKPFLILPAKSEILGIHTPLPIRRLKRNPKLHI